MSNDFTLSAVKREDQGKGASRRLRREAGLVPAVVYGGKSKKPAAISVTYRELAKALENEAFYSHIIELNIDGKAENVVLKDLQRHPSKPVIYHADFLRVNKTQKIKMSVPLHFLNEDTCVAVKMQGGKISHNMNELEVECTATNLPEFIEVDLADVEMGQVVHISDVKLPKGVVSVALSHGADHDLPVATIAKPKGAAADEEASEEAGEE